MSKLTLEEAISHCLEVANNPLIETTIETLDTELREAKRLLKAAVEDFANIEWHMYECDGKCNVCPLCGERDNCLRWRYADEVKKLINS